jgi:hypothetical protein
MMTYALGRGMEYYDVEALDRIIGQLERENGKFSALLMGVIESAPFQKRRDNNALAGGRSVDGSQQLAQTIEQP